MKNYPIYKVERPEWAKPKFIVGKTVEGYVARLKAIPVGEERYTSEGDIYYDDHKQTFEAMFNGSIIPCEIKQRLAENPPKTIENVIGTDLEQYLVKEGENAGGLKITRINENGTPYDANRVDFEDGAFGLRLLQQIPAKDWAKIKPYGRHIDLETAEDYLDDCDIFNADASDYAGWFYSDEAAAVLIAAGYDVYFCKEKITNSIAETRAAVEERKKALAAERERRNAIFADVKATYNAVRKTAEKMTADGVKAVAAVLKNEILCPKIGVKGHNIYGSGVYLAADENAVYFVENNGMDGDDWSQNNYGTNGAGAIVYAAKRNADADRLLAEIEKINNLKPLK